MPKFLLLIALLTASQLSLAFTPCRIEGYSHEIECQHLTTTPNAAGKRAAANITVHRVLSTVRYPKPSPIIWIPDNLSVDASRIAPSRVRMLRRVRHHRHFMWLDIRDQKNQPLLNCPATQARINQLHAKKTITDRLLPLNQSRDLQQCQQTLNTKPLNSVSPSQIAAYYESVRLQLGLGKVVIIAEGRGADVALAWQKNNPNSIAFQAFESPVYAAHSPSYRAATAIKMQQLLSAVMTACQQDKSCNQTVNNPDELLNSVIASLPQTTKLRNALTHKFETVTIDDALLYAGLSRILNTPEKAALLPSALQHALQQDWQPFIGLQSLNWRKQLVGQNIGAFLAQRCLGYSPKTTSNQNWFYNQALAQLTRLCTGLDIKAPQIQAPFINQVPTLTFIGGLQFSAQLPKQPSDHDTVINVPHGGYRLLSNGCAKDILYRYFKLQDSQPSNEGHSRNSKQTDTVNDLRAACLVDVPPPNINIQF